ncbi:MAG: TrmB family transcriptional regulator [Candidatus Methanofastidiosia archaeon]
MNIKDELCEMGFTDYNARVLVSAIKFGKASAKNIAYDSGVPYSRIYEPLNTLIEEGWIKREESRPALYYPDNVNERLDEFIQTQRKKIDQLKINLKEMSKEQIVITPTINVGYGLKPFLSRLEDHIEFSHNIAGVLGFSHEAALEHLKILTKKRFRDTILFAKDSLLANKRFNKDLAEIAEGVSVRLLPFTPTVWLFLFDKKDVLIALPALSPVSEASPENFKFLEIKNFDMGNILEKIMNIALIESAPYKNATP